jgi:alkylation response protein AidB-like acyl-CoA dehydrogenase
MFTSQGHLADYCLMIARTGSDKHNGLTVFVVPLNQPGYSLSAVDTVGDERTNITFYSEVQVPDSFRLGEVDAGVKVLAAALVIEQGGTDFFAQALKHMLHTAEEWARATAETGILPIGRSTVRARLAAAKTAGLIADLLARRAIWAASVGQSHKSFGPMAKLFGTEAWVRCADDLLALTAPASLFRTTHDLARIEKETRRSVPSTIYAGTSEVQRSLIAESALGLPRSRS